ncbi:gamma-glutamylcyclotransferase [Pseudochrobactrum sp. HB0163]|uniref:gamma-glutamylcyclotransferase n=1 Tax=Pseudochrobactrum sp. HB0163 TaxID=3450708 RepID=UPI003F6DF678
MTTVNHSFGNTAPQQRLADAQADLWVFGYGSLMWRPGFESEESLPALLRGYKRSLCIYSHIYRGTPEKPGLVLGLDRGGFCHGQAFRVAGMYKEPVLDYLREREQVTGVYIEKYLTVELIDGRQVEALVYVADPAHEQYAGFLSEQAKARMVGLACGQAGANRDYVINTVHHLQAMNIRDERLDTIVRLLGQ